MEPVKIAVPVPVDRDTGLTPLISPRMRVGAVFELPNGQLYTLGPGRRAQKIPHL